MAMNLHLLRIFATVARRKSFSRAAEELVISQPAVSKGVRELERQLGLPLLDRSRGGVTLTEAGETLLSYALRIFTIEDAAEVAIAQLKQVERGKLAIGASATIGIYLLPTLLGAFHRRYPDAQPSLDIAATYDILQRLLTSPLDIAFVEGPVDVEGLIVTPWREDTLVVIAAPDHPLALAQRQTQSRGQSATAMAPTQRPIGSSVAASHKRFVQGIVAEGFIQREPGSGTREIVDAGMRERGISLRVAMEVNNTEGVKQMVSAGLGLAIVPTVTIAAELATGRLVTLDAPELTLRRWLWRAQVVDRPVSPALRAFLAILSEAEQARVIQS